MKLDARLTAVADMVPQGAKIADIGTDHAYLPVTLVLKHKVAFAIAADVHEGPCQAAAATVGRAGLAKEVPVRLGDGLAVLHPHEVETVIIAGLGGSTIIQILAAHAAVREHLERLILQPMNGAALLRKWLAKHNWQFDEESLVEEEGRLYEIIRVIKKNVLADQVDEPISPVLYEIGPLLWRNKHPLLKRQLLLKIQSLEDVLQALERSASLSAAQKSRQCHQQLAQLKEMMICL